jgi:hypothetical protein
MLSTINNISIYYIPDTVSVVFFVVVVSFYFFLGVLEFELRASSLLGMCCTT